MKSVPQAAVGSAPPTSRIRTPTCAEGIETEIGVVVFQSWSAPLVPAFVSCTVPSSAPVTSLTKVAKT